MRLGDLQVGDTIVPATPGAGYTGIVSDKSEGYVLVYWYREDNGRPHSSNPFGYEDSHQLFNYKKGVSPSDEAEWE